MLIYEVVKIKETMAKNHISILHTLCILLFAQHTKYILYFALKLLDVQKKLVIINELLLASKNTFKLTMDLFSTY